MNTDNLITTIIQQTKKGRPKKKVDINKITSDINNLSINNDLNITDNSIIIQNR